MPSPAGAGRGPARAARPVLIRPVEPDDLPALDALLDSLDAQSRYRRWFTGGADVHQAALWAAHPEPQSAVGLVATTSDGGLVGHAALVPYADGTRAEVCFEVAAPWRRHGIAGRLLAELDRQAQCRGITTLVAEVLPENAACSPSCTSTARAASILTATSSS